MPITPITTGVKVTYSRENFQTATANRNSWATDNAEHLTYIKEEGITEGFYPKVVPGLNQIQIRYSDADQTKPGGNNMIGTGVRLTSGGFVPFSLFSNASVILTVPNNPNPTVIYYLLCWKFNAANTDEGELVFMPGGVTTDPDLDQEELDLPGVRYLPICRIERTNTTLVQGDVKLIGATTYNPNKTVRPLIKYQNSSVQVLTTVERSAAVLNDATLFLLRDTTADGTLKFYDASQNKDISLKQTEVLYTLTSPIALGQYTASSANVGNIYQRVPRVSPASVFDDIFTGATGTGTLTIPANSLKVGDKLVFDLEIGFDSGAGNANVPMNNFGLFLWKINGSYLNSGGTALRSIYGLFSAWTGTMSNRGEFESFYAGSVASTAFTNARASIRYELTIQELGANGKFALKIDGARFQTTNFIQVWYQNDVSLFFRQGDINTTINNTFNADFGCYRIGASGFNHTFRLEKALIYKN